MGNDSFSCATLDIRIAPMTLPGTETLEAVVFFSEDVISRELLYPEFEAILDGFIPVPDFKGTSAKAVYLVVNSNLCVTAAVFFLLDFDGKGMVATANAQ
jgi:hypothetical protein